MFENIYNGRHVFVTGHTGFKGSWLCAWLLSLGAHVTGYANGLPSEPSLYETLDLAGKITDKRGDIRDLPYLSQCLRESGAEIVFHLAAQALVRESYRDPELTFTTNAGGTLNALEAARKTDTVKACVIITSDKCYRNNEWVYGYRETDRLGGADPYSASKACAEIIAHSYFQSYYDNGPNAATARAGNVIGGGDWAKDRIIPDCARAWAKGQNVTIRSPNATRPWQLVLEPLSGYLWLGSKLFGGGQKDSSIFTVAGESYNFGPPAEGIHTVLEVCKQLERHWPHFAYEAQNTDNAGMKESTLLKLCCDKALAELDWHAVLDFEEAMRFTSEWYARFYAQNDKSGIWNYTLGQIAAYENLAKARNLRWALK